MKTSSLLFLLIFYMIGCLKGQSSGEDLRQISFRPKHFSISYGSITHIWDKPANLNNIENNFNVGIDASIAILKLWNLKLDIHIGSYTKNINKNAFPVSGINGYGIDNNVYCVTKYLGFGLGLMNGVTINRKIAFQPSIVYSLADAKCSAYFWEATTNNDTTYLFHEISRKQHQLLQINADVNFLINNHSTIGVRFGTLSELELSNLWWPLIKKQSIYTPFFYKIEKPIVSINLGIQYTYLFQINKSKHNNKLSALW